MKITFAFCRWSRAEIADFRATTGSLTGVSLDNFENGAEDGFARSAAHQETVQVGQPNQVLAVCLSDRPAVDDTDPVGHLATNLITDPVADVLAGLLGLVRAGNRPGADCPERLVNNHDFRPVFDVVLQGRKLFMQHFQSLFFVFLLGCFTHAVYDAEVAVLGAADLLGNLILGLSEELPALGVADEYVLNAVVFDVVCAHFAGVGTWFMHRNILGSDLHALLNLSFHKAHVEQAGKKHQIYDNKLANAVGGHSPYLVYFYPTLGH